jgi:hypothetical protein
MTAYDSTSDVLIDAALEIMGAGKPIQIRVTREIDGLSEYAVGHVTGAYRARGIGTATVLEVGGTTLRVTDEEWAIITHEEPDEPASLTPEEYRLATEGETDPARPEWHTGGEPVDPAAGNIVHALRWYQGRPVGHHEAVVLRRLSEDQFLVRYTLDGYESAAAGFNIRATPTTHFRLQQMEVTGLYRHGDR